MADWESTIKDIPRVKNTADTSNMEDADKYILATNYAQQTASESDQEFNKHQMDALIDSYYDELMPTEYSGKDFRGQTGLRGILNSIDSNMDYGIGKAGDAVDYAFDNTIGEIGDGSAKDWFDGDDAAGVLDTAATIGLGLIPGVGIPMAVGKTAIDSSDDIADAFTGVENQTGEKLNSLQRTNRGLGAIANIGTSALPGIGSAARTANLGKIFNQATGGIGSRMAAGRAAQNAIKNAGDEAADLSRNALRLENEATGSILPRLRAPFQGGARRQAERTAEQNLRNQAMQRTMPEQFEEAAERAAMRAARTGPKRIKNFLPWVGRGLANQGKMIPAHVAAGVGGSMAPGLSAMGVSNDGVTTGGNSTFPSGAVAAANMIVPILSRGRINPMNLAGRVAPGATSYARDESQKEANQENAGYDINELIRWLQASGV